jgi:lipopolysaccharide export system protein LptA
LFTLKKKLILIVILLVNISLLFAQKTSKIEVEYSDFADVNQIELPDGLLLTGNVRVSHDGIIMTCNKAYYYQKENYIKAFGDVEMIQGDTLTMTSKYAEYNGAIKKAYASGNVVMDSPESTLTTDTIYFDRNIQEVYFNSNGTIVNKKNTLKSKAGRYYVKEKKYQFLSAVELKNPEYTIKSNHLDYKTTHGNSILKGPSTIVGKETFIYTENGHYNSKKNTGHFLQKSFIKYKDQLIEGDSLYYDRKIEYAAGTNNVKITDSINKAIVKGHYGEVFKQKDSLYITKHASIRFLSEKDSMFIHAKKIFVTGKVGERVIRGQKNVRFYKTDLSGKCDSINSDQKKALTQLIGKPILWNFENQLTGDLMHLIGNNKTEKIDSLKVLNNSFIISKDTVGTGYNQVKGLNLYSKFKNNKIYETDVVKNAEVIFYMRNDAQELIGINKSVCSKINMIMDDNNNIETITLYNNPDGDIFPEKDLPENARLLRGFEWRGDERIKSKDDIYPADEVEMHNAIVLRSKEKYEVEKGKRDIEDTKLQDKISSYEVYDNVFRNHNNRIVVDKNNNMFLVRNYKFRFPENVNSFSEYIKKHPKYKDVVKIDHVLWNWETMPGKMYDGGLFKGNDGVEELEFPKKDYLTLEEIFKLYNDKLIIDKNGTELLVSNGVFKLPENIYSGNILKKNYPKYRKQIRINQVLWDSSTMSKGKYDGGIYNGQ